MVVLLLFFFEANEVIYITLLNKKVGTIVVVYYSDLYQPKYHKLYKTRVVLLELSAWKVKLGQANLQDCKLVTSKLTKVLSSYKWMLSKYKILGWKILEVKSQN